RLQRALALEREQLVLLDDRGRQVLSREDLVPREAEPFAQAQVQVGVRGLVAADRVASAFLDDQRDQRALALQVLPRGREAADRDDLPRRVPERVEEEGALLADHVSHLVARCATVLDRAEELMVKPRMRHS